MKRIIMPAALCFLTGAAFALIQVQEDFTPAQVGTLPAGWTASYEPDIDVEVVTRATMFPAIAADHAGGDDHVFRVGDIGSGGGLYNWAFKSTQTANTVSTVSVWLYVDLTTGMNAVERNYVIGVRQANIDPQVAGGGTATRQGYLFSIGANAAWSGISPNPVNRKPFFVSKNSAGVHSVAGGVYGANDVTDGWHKIDLVLSGTSLKAYIDGTLAVDAVDSSHSSGYTALGYYEENGSPSYPAAAAFDNLVIEVPDPINAAQDWSIFE